jgi:hypothetical protein
MLALSNLVQHPEVALSNLAQQQGVKNNSIPALSNLVQHPEVALSNLTQQQGV